MALSDRFPNCNLRNTSVLEVLTCISGRKKNLVIKKKVWEVVLCNPI